MKFKDSFYFLGILYRRITKIRGLFTRSDTESDRILSCRH